MPRSQVFNRIAKNQGYDPLGVDEEGLGASVDDEEMDGVPTPYDGIARAGSEPRDITPGKLSGGEEGDAAAPGGPDYGSDPLMQRFDKDQQLAARYQQMRSQAQGDTNFIQAISQAANGVNAPKSNDDVFKNINAQGDANSKFLSDQTSAREKVIEAIGKRRAVNSQNAIANELKQQRLGLDTTKASNSKASRDALTDAYKQRTSVIGSTAGNRMDNSNIRTANSLLNDTNLKKETTKLNTARSAQSLVDAIRSGELTDSGNISKQLTNMIQTIELGNPGGVGDRQSSGVDTLYSRAKDTLSFLSGHPQSRIPKEYLDQLENEVHALGNRAAKNYKTTSDSALMGADLSGGVPGGDAGKVHGLAQQRRDELLRANGYDPATGEPIAKTGAEKTVMVVDPTGITRAIPSSQVQDALAAGGRLK